MGKAQGMGDRPAHTGADVGPGGRSADPKHLAGVRWGPASELSMDRRARPWERVPGATPLLPVAVCATLGAIADRYLAVPANALVLCALVLLVAWGVLYVRGVLAARWALWLAAFFLTWCWSWQDRWQAPDDVTRGLTDQPQWVRLRGVVVSDVRHYANKPRPLATRVPTQGTTFTLQVSHVVVDGQPRSARGRVRVRLRGEHRLAWGDRVELVGHLARPAAPANPGERDSRQALLDQGIGAVLQVKSPQGLLAHEPHWAQDLSSFLAALRRRGVQALGRYLDQDQAALAGALILGDQEGVDPEVLERYRRTGVLHALVISGQHLIILYGGIMSLARLARVGRTRAALVVLPAMLGYGMLTGWEAPVARAALVSCVLWAGVWLGRPYVSVNALCLAWLVTLWCRPTEIFRPGCQLSFLCVLVLVCLYGPLREEWAQRRERRVLPAQEHSSWVARLLRWLGRELLWSWLASLCIWVVAAPLLAARYQLVTPIAVLLTPFVVLCVTVALLAGLLLVVLVLVFPWGAQVCAVPLAWALGASDWLTRRAEQLPLGHWFAGGPDEVWLWAFYVPLLAVMLWLPARRYWRIPLGLALASLAGAWLASSAPTGEALRCTFLSVDHGLSVVLELPDGRTMVYDVGSLGGPERIARSVLPFLYARGLHRIDELIVSHADADHFNGLAVLLERVRLGGVSTNPSFVRAGTPAVRQVVDLLQEHSVPLRTLRQGDTVRAGEAVLQVVHPPGEGPIGPENARSVVLLVEYQGRRILLTGDLEPPGLDRVVRRPIPPVDVLLAPHHGSPNANTLELGKWARPKLVVSSQSWQREAPQVYRKLGATVWSTARTGAVLVEIRKGQVLVRAWRTGEELRW